MVDLLSCLPTDIIVLASWTRDIRENTQHTLAEVVCVCVCIDCTRKWIGNAVKIFRHPPYGHVISARVYTI